MTENSDKIERIKGRTLNVGEYIQIPPGEVFQIKSVQMISPETEMKVQIHYTPEVVEAVEKEQKEQIKETIARTRELWNTPFATHFIDVSNPLQPRPIEDNKVECPYCHAEINKGKLIDHLKFCEIKDEKKEEKRPRKIIMDESK